MCEKSFDGFKITWEQMSYLKSILTPNQLFTFLATKDQKIVKDKEVIHFDKDIRIFNSVMERLDEVNETEKARIQEK